EADTALDIVAGQDDADKAAALVLLATLLDAAALPAACDVADGIGAAHLRLEPAILLAALAPEPGGERLAGILRLLGEVTGGLSRLKPTIDRLASLIEPGHATALRPVLAELIQELPTDDLLVLCPVGALVSEPDYYSHV